MKRLFVLAFFCLSCSLCAEDTVKMSGTFVWDKKKKEVHDITAEFEPDGKGKWKATFYFKFWGNDHTYTGDVKGYVGKGKRMSGTIYNDDKKRKFIFSGNFRSGGVLKVKHHELEGRREKKTYTGTMELTVDE